MSDHQAAGGNAILNLLHQGKSAVSLTMAEIHAMQTSELAATLTEEGIRRFELSLKERIDTQFAKWPEHPVCVSVDYHPDEILSHALQAGGMTDSRWDYFFPFKTTVRIQPDWSFEVMRI